MRNQVLTSSRKLSLTRPVTTAVLALLALSACGRALPTRATAPNVRPVQAMAQTSLDNYYRSVSTLKGMNLMRGLNKLARSGQKVMSYDQARDAMFGRVDDRVNNNTVIDIYCGRTSKGVTDRKSAFQRGLNAEHTWPQSMGAQEEPAKSDLHHLYPADSGTNSTRNNHAYGIPATVTETLPNYLGDNMNSKIGKLADGTTVFEPRDDHKGDAARAMFFFYMRYGYGASKKSGVSIDNFRREFATLWRWHYIDPPSAKEKARHELVYAYQRTRNPFIDHPEYVERIGHFLAPGRAYNSEPGETEIQRGEAYADDDWKLIELNVGDY